MLRTVLMDSDLDNVMLLECYTMSKKLLFQI